VPPAIAVMAGFMLWATVLSGYGYAAGNAPQIVVPLVSGSPNPAVWQSAPHVEDFTAIADGSKVPGKVRCAFLRSRADLYVRCSVAERKSQVDAARDSAKIQQGDYLAVALSLGRQDGHPVQYVFMVNPVGARAVLSSVTQHFSAPWVGDVTTIDDRWLVGVTIPFSSLAIPPPTMQQWRIGIMVQDHASGGLYVWPYIDGRFPPADEGEALIPDLTVR
jgi:hypothetical protein